MDKKSDVSDRAESPPAATDAGDANKAFRSTPPHRAFGLYLLLAAAWGYAIHYFGREFTIRPPWIVFVGVVLFSVPVVLSGLYLNTTKKTRNLAVYDRTGLLYRILSGRILATFIWSIWAFVSTFFVLLQFHPYSTWEWAGFFLVVPLFWLVHTIVRSFVGGQIKPYLASATAIRAARRITPIVATIAYFAVVCSYSFAELPQHQTLGEAISYAKSRGGEYTSSALIFELVQYQAYYDGAKYFILGQFHGDQAIWAFLLLSIGGYVIFFSASTMLSCFAIPPREYRRVFSPLSDADNPPQMTGWDFWLTSAIFSFVVLFVLLPIFTSVEQQIRNDNDPFVEARKKADFLVVQIDDAYYLPSTPDELRDIQVKALRRMDSLLPDLDRELDRAFATTEANVDSFLDWYYTLKAEYLRTLNLLAGNFEDHLAKKLTEHLQHGAPFKAFEAKVTEALTLQNEIQAEFIREAKAVLARTRVEPPEDVNLVVVQKMALPQVLTLPEHRDMLAIEKRLGLSGGAGVIAAVATKKIIAKVAAKGTLKIAGTALAKMIGGKAVAGFGGAAGGAAAGAAIGSVVPGIGTAIGGIIGGFVGAVTAGVAVDKGLLMLEDYFGRNQFREDLLSAIRETRAAFEAELHN